MLRLMFNADKADIDRAETSWLSSSLCESVLTSSSSCCAEFVFGCHIARHARRALCCSDSRWPSAALASPSQGSSAASPGSLCTSGAVSLPGLLTVAFPAPAVARCSKSKASCSSTSTFDCRDFAEDTDAETVIRIGDADGRFPSRAMSHVARLGAHRRARLYIDTRRHSCPVRMPRTHTPVQ